MARNRLGSENSWASWSVSTAQSKGC